MAEFQPTASHLECACVPATTFVFLLRLEFLGSVGLVDMQPLWLIHWERNQIRVIIETKAVTVMHHVWQRLQNTHFVP